MKTIYSKLATILVISGLLAAGPVLAQQPAVAPEQSPATTAPATAKHNDPIVQKRMEIRQANREHRAKKSAARQAFKNEARQSKAERNQAAAESRARAQQALDSQQ